MKGYCNRSCTFIIDRTEFMHNRATLSSQAGAISIEKIGTLLISDSTFVYFSIPNLIRLTYLFVLYLI